MLLGSLLPPQWSSLHRCNESHFVLAGGPHRTTLQGSFVSTHLPQSQLGPLPSGNSGCSQGISLSSAGQWSSPATCHRGPLLGGARSSLQGPRRLPRCVCRRGPGVQALRPGPTPWQPCRRRPCTADLACPRLVRWRDPPGQVLQLAQTSAAQHDVLQGWKCVASALSPSAATSHLGLLSP